MSFMPYVPPEQLMKDRSDFAHKGIARGKSVVGLEYAEGILFLAENPSATLHKISEIYDRIAFAGVGKYSEFEELRIAGVRLADMRGYSYDREDVRAKDLANAYSQALSTIFTQQMKPYEVEILVAEVADDGRPNEVYHILFDGTVTDEHGSVAIGGHAETLDAAVSEAYREDWDLGTAVREAVKALSAAESREIEASSIEAGVLERPQPRRRKFRRLAEDQIAGFLQPPS
jgi:proteasome alpha subunit